MDTYPVAIRPANTPENSSKALHSGSTHTHARIGEHLEVVVNFMWFQILLRCSNSPSIGGETFRWEKVEFLPWNGGSRGGCVRMVSFMLECARVSSITGTICPVVVANAAWGSWWPRWTRWVSWASSTIWQGWIWASPTMMRTPPWFMQRGSATTTIMSRRHDREWWMKEEKGQCEEQGIYQRTTCNASANQSMASITPTHPSRSPIRTLALPAALESSRPFLAGTRLAHRFSMSFVRPLPCTCSLEGPFTRLDSRKA